jgi:hypothetical protein
MKVNELKDFTRGQLDAALMKIGHDAGMTTAEGIRAFLRGELIVIQPTRSWREEDGVIYFSVESDGTTGEDWIKRLEEKGYHVNGYAKKVLRSPDFKPTNGVTTEVAVLKGTLFEGNDRKTEKIYAEGALRKLSKPNAEMVCLIREKFTSKELKAMGLAHIIVMYEPIGGSLLLSVEGEFFQDNGLGCCYYGFECTWGRDCGCAFAVSQVSS